MTDDDQIIADTIGTDAAEPEPDPNGLGSILSAALADVDSAGGRDQHLLRSVIGEKIFGLLPQRGSTSKALQTWLDASPESKPKATRMLAVSIARATGKPELVDRIEREIGDMDPFATDVPPVKAQDNSRVQKTLPRAATKVAPRDGYLDMLRLATKGDATDYIRARGGS
jgi:hypothetical protein